MTKHLLFAAAFLSFQLPVVIAAADAVSPARIVHSEVGGTLTLPVPEGVLTLRAVSPSVIGVRVVAAGATSKYESVTIVNSLPAKTTLSERDGEWRFSTGTVVAAVEKKTGRIRFLDAGTGRELLAEATGGRRFTKGEVSGEPVWAPEQTFVSPEGESLYGLGQHQDGRLDWRGETLRLGQTNSEISVPFLWSTEGYGLLWDNPSSTWFNPGEEVPLTDNKGVLRVPESGEYSLWLDHTGTAGCWDKCNIILLDGKAVVDQRNKWVPHGAGVSLHLEAGRDYAAQVEGQGGLKLYFHRKTPITTWRSRVGEAVEYYFVHGATPAQVMVNYRAVSGHSPMLPKYAYGYWQCRERYNSSAELVEAVEKFREKDIPVDIIVQDWMYWEKYGWNAMKWDERRYPDVPLLTRTLHEKNVRLVASVWSKFDKHTDVYKELFREGAIVGDSEWFDPTNPKGREIYWKHSKAGHFDQGVDGYWQDATEPESECLWGAKLHLGTGDRYLNAYPLFVNRAVYEGNRASSEGKKRLCDLTRSAYAGQQRYGAISWSGDIKGDWDAFRRQIPAGLGFTSSGIPYWTTDIGGFFRPGSPFGPAGSQYTSQDFRELLCRWLQCGTFFPVQRMHGYVSRTEPWNYGAETEAVLVKALKLRYRFLPYIYSTAHQVHLGADMMKPLAMDFPAEKALRDIRDQFLFGDALLVAPIVEPRVKTGDKDAAPVVAGPAVSATIPLASDSGSKPLASADPAGFATDKPSVRTVMLPHGTDWYDFWSGRRIPGGTISVAAPIDIIPLFVKAGSILPYGPELRHTGEVTDKPVELRVYPGADAAFPLYDDAGEGYAYEKGEYAVVPLRWDDSTRTLTVGERRGAYPGMPATRNFLVRLLQKDGSWKDTAVTYDGKSVVVKE